MLGVRGVDQIAASITVFRRITLYRLTCGLMSHRRRIPTAASRLLMGPIVSCYPPNGGSGSIPSSTLRIRWVPNRILTRGGSREVRLQEAPVIRRSRTGAGSGTVPRMYIESLKQIREHLRLKQVNFFLGQRCSIGVLTLP